MSLINRKKLIPLFYNHATNPVLFLQNEINRAINDFYNVFQNSSNMIDVEKFILNPFVDILEDEKHFKVIVEMPGMREEDIKISINNKTLSIQGKKEISKKDEGKKFMSREISYGSYERNILLPDYIEPDSAKASFKKGVLRINFNKKTKSDDQYREIKIEKSSSQKQSLESDNTNTNESQETTESTV